MTGKTGVHPDCRNSSNPYHECSEFCFKFIAEAKKLAAKNEPAGLKAETRSSQPTSITTSVQTELPGNEKSEADDLPSGDDNTTTEDQPQVDFTKLIGKQKKLFELRLKMNEARKANQSAMVAEKKRKDGPQESRGISKHKWLDERKKKIGKLLDANGLDMKEAHTQQVVETKYKKWEKEPAPAGWDGMCFYNRLSAINNSLNMSSMNFVSVKYTLALIITFVLRFLPIAYHLQSRGFSRFLLFSTSKDHLILKASKNEDEWRRKFFFVKRDSIVKGVNLPMKWLTFANFKELAPPSAESEQRIKEIYRLPESERTFSLYFASLSQKSSSNMSAPAKTLKVFDLEELDNYSGPVQVNKEPSLKPATSSKPVSSKATVVPKPSTATKPRGSSPRKRKESDSPATSTFEAFPYENHGFLESSRFMTSFLNQGLERLMHLYEDSCGLNKMLEAKLKKAETTIANQEAIAAVKSQHYEDKYKAVTQEAQTAINKVNQEAQLKLDAAQLQHEHDMNSYRECLKGSVVISLLQARLKMAYEARALGFECPFWNVASWEAKLKDLGGNPVELPAKPVVEESSKAAEIEVDAGGDAENDAGADPGAGAGDEAMVEEGAAS
ncbi:putative mRNA splicing factor SYF2 [Helianthus anomalus]